MKILGVALLFSLALASPAVETFWLHTLDLRTPSSLLSWRLNSTLLAIVSTALGASCDEFHQSFVPTRTASGWDVLIDTSGALTALLLVGLAGLVGRAGSASAGGPPPTSP